MTPDEVVAYLEGIRDKAAKAAPDCAMAMGRVHEDQLKNVTLTRFQSVPMTQTPSPRDVGPPASMTGTLRRSITCTRGAGGGMHASAAVAPHTVYAATQEWGDIHTGKPHMWLWLKYAGAYEVRRRGWVKHVVDIPKRPYMRPSRDAVIASGAVQAAGSAAFMREVFG